MTARNRQLLNTVLLLSLPIMIGGLLFWAMGGHGVSISLRLFLLSLFGIYPTLKFIRHKNTSNKRLAYVYGFLALLWWLIFTMHGLALSASWFIFGGSIDSFFIIQAIANTTQAEMLEFLSFHWLSLLLTIMALLGMVGGYFFALFKWFDNTTFDLFKATKSYKVLLCLFTLICVVSYAIKPSRNHSPFIFWYKYSQKINAFKNETNKHHLYQKDWLNFANQHITATDDAPQTHLLVISESLTSQNMGVCGYPRNTTPFIHQHEHELTIFCEAYSRYPTTIDAIKSMLTDIESNPHATPTQSLLGFAKVAGFKTFWISNQDDAYLSSLFGNFADERIYHNKLSGRSSFNIDEEILPYVDYALKDTAHKKLIIVHLIGSHPNYSARYPKRFAIFPNDKKGSDHLNAHFDAHQISAVTRQYRDYYDNSVVYQDWIFNELLHKIKSGTHPIRSLTFLSDHGNEVGHEKDYAGHSHNTKAGYQVPIILWHNHHPKLDVDKNTPIDASLLDNYMLDVMNIHTNINQPVSWTNPDHQFIAPDNFPYWQNPPK